MTTEQTADAMTTSFRAATGKRKGSAFHEAGDWWVIDAAGHQWCFADGGWVRFTDDDDAHVLELAAERRAVSVERVKARS